MFEQTTRVKIIHKFWFIYIGASPIYTNISESPKFDKWIGIWFILSIDISRAHRHRK